MKRGKEELEFGEVAEACLHAQTGGEVLDEQSRKRHNKKTAKRANPKHREEPRVTKEDDADAVESPALTSPSDWFFAQFLKSCSKTLSQIEQERSIPAQSVSALPQSVSQAKSPIEEYLVQHIRPLLPSHGNAEHNKSKERATTGVHILATPSTDPDQSEPGSPLALIISASAIRCVDLLRHTQALGPQCRTAKLFSKHIKLPEQLKQLSSTVHVAAGTPNRLLKLLASGALKLSSLRAVVLDLKPDAKAFTLLTLPDTRVDFWELYRSHLHDAVCANDLRLVISEWQGS